MTYVPNISEVRNVHKVLVKKPERGNTALNANVAYGSIILNWILLKIKVSVTLLILTQLVKQTTYYNPV